MFLEKVAFPAPVLTHVHSKPEHAMHEDCAVSHAGTIKCPGVDVMQIGAHYDVPECPVCRERHIRVTIEGIQIVLVVIYCHVQSSQAAELHLDYGVEAAK